MRQGPYTETVAIASSAVITERISEKFIERVDKQPATRPTVFVSLSLNWLYRIHKDRSIGCDRELQKAKEADELAIFHCRLARSKYLSILEGSVRLVKHVSWEVNRLLIKAELHIISIIRCVCTGPHIERIDVPQAIRVVCLADTNPIERLFRTWRVDATNSLSLEHCHPETAIVGIIEGAWVTQEWTTAIAASRIRDTEEALRGLRPAGLKRTAWAVNGKWGIDALEYPVRRCGQRHIRWLAATKEGTDRGWVGNPLKSGGSTRSIKASGGRFWQSGLDILNERSILVLCCCLFPLRVKCWVGPS